MDDKKNGLLIIILLAIVAVIVLFFPQINKFIEKLKMPKIHQTEEESKVEIKEIDEELLSDLHYPVMRNSIYNADSYYKLDKFTISNMSNQDILYNAFLDIEPVTFANVGVYKCATDSKSFSTKKLDLRIKNILGKNLKYNYESFNVPEGSSSSYVGEWTYDSANSKFIYSGICNKVTYNTKYIDLKQDIKAEYKDKDLIVYSYIGFAKVENGSYVIYKDPSMTEQLGNGTYVSDEDLNKQFENYDNKSKRIYKYTFKNNLCSYGEYCLSQSEWVDKI